MMRAAYPRWVDLVCEGMGKSDPDRIMTRSSGSFNYMWVEGEQPTTEQAGEVPDRG